MKAKRPLNSGIKGMPTGPGGRVGFQEYMYALSAKIRRAPYQQSDRSKTIDGNEVHKLDEALDTCRWLYNHLLEEISKSKENGVQLKIYDTQNMIPSLKLENPDLRNVYSKVLQMVDYTL